MDRNALDRLLASGPVTGGCASGTELAKRGLSAGACPELWAAGHPDVLKGLYGEAITAGVQFVATPTHGGSPLKLARYGLEDRCEEMNAACARTAREAAMMCPVAASVGPTGEAFAPMGRAVHEELVSMYRRQVAGLLQGDPDFFLLEAFTDMAEARAAVLAVKELCGLPFAVSMAFEGGGAQAGVSQEAAAATFTALGASAFGCNGAKPERGGALLLASQHSIAEVSLGGPLCVIGERINPSGKPALAEGIRKGLPDEALALARGQQAAGVCLLDVNAGTGGVDEADALCMLIEELSAAVPLPLSLDSADPEALAAAVRLYSGRALMNSVADSPHACGLLQTAAFYGAVPVLMPLEGRSLPQTAMGRRAVIDRLLEKAVNAGFGKSGLLVDCGTPCAAMCAGNPAEAVEFARQMHGLGYLTVSGVSNVSWGLPNRGALNAAWLAALMGAGLSAAILNPTKEMMDNVAACSVLRGDDAYCTRYIDRMRLHQ